MENVRGEIVRADPGAQIGIWHPASSPLVHAKNARVNAAGVVSVSFLLSGAPGDPATGTFQYQGGSPAKMLVTVKGAGVPAGPADLVLDTRDINCVDQPAIHVSGAYHPIPLPPYRPVVTTGGWTFTIERLPKLHLAQAALIDVSVRDAAGHPAEFTPWFGAMGHAIFFHEGDLAYFHTHICAPNQAGCASIGGPTSITGSSTKPGVMHVGVLLPETGTWRLFLQCKVDGRILTAPFTLRVAG